MNKLVTLWSICLLAAFGLQAKTRPTVVDSVGIEKKDGKVFILHRVEEGQTLYSIARRYNTSVDFIQQANTSLGNVVQYNQVIRIPMAAELSRKEQKALEKAARAEKKEAASSNQSVDPNELYKPDNKTKSTNKANKQQVTEDSRAAQKIESELKANPGFLVVEAGQTLYSLSVKYNVLLADLRKWNKLTSDNVRVGQELIVSEKAYLARQAGSTPTKVEGSKSEWTKLDTRKNEPAKPESAKPESPKAVIAKAGSAPDHTIPDEHPSRTAEPVDNSPATVPAKGRRISEIGMADVINANDLSSKYLALHRSAPVGSLVQVRNDINNASLWVKVIGRLPDTGVNDRILIKLSAKAFEKLSPNQQRFRAEVTYLVP